MTFAYPWLLALPLLYLLLRYGLKTTTPAVAFPSASFLSSLPKSFKQQAREPVLTSLMLITVIALSIAAARPQRVTIIEQPRTARNIMLVVDASNSMSAQDFPVQLGHTSRMEGIKGVVAEYVRTRSRDRVGLVVFGNTSYLQAPLTTDTALVEEMVKAMQPRMAGDGTAIGDGLGLALKRLRDVKDGTKAIILMTDGVNTAGQVSPLKAAQIAKDLGVQIHTIGIGTGSSPIVQQPLGGLLNVPVGRMAEFDEKTLREIADLTGGAYFNAGSLADFKKVYEKIEKLTETEEEQPDRPLVEELFAPWALTAFIAYAITLLLSCTFFMKVP